MSIFLYELQAKKSRLDLDKGSIGRVSPAQFGRKQSNFESSKSMILRFKVPSIIVAL